MTDYRVDPGEVEEDQFTAANRKNDVPNSYQHLSCSGSWRNGRVRRPGTRSTNPCLLGSGLRPCCCWVFVTSSSSSMDPMAGAAVETRVTSILAHVVTGRP